ncbi:MAG: phage portal protein [Prevotella sp.]|nr:phage portal protein [Prevotella sp.]
MRIITDAKRVYGFSVPDFGDFYGYIEYWDGIFQNRPPWRRVKKSGLYAKGDRAMGTLCAAKVLADEFARLTFSEQVTVSAAEPYLEYVTEALNDNGFWKRMPEFLSGAYALGGGAVKIYAEEKKPRLNYIAADRFVPVDWNEREISGGILESKIRRNGFYYTLFEKHGFSESGCTEVTHSLFKSAQKNGIGKPCELSELFPDIDEVVTYRTSEPMLRYFKPDFGNNLDRYCPLGVSVFSCAVDTLKALDVAFDSFGREFILGKKRNLRR